MEAPGSGWDQYLQLLSYSNIHWGRLLAAVFRLCIGYLQAIYRLFTRLIYRAYLQGWPSSPYHVDSSLLSAWYLSRAWKTYWAREDTSRLLPSGMSMVTRSPILGTSFWARLSAVEMTSMITTAPSPHLSRGVPLRPRLSVVRVLSGEKEVSVRPWVLSNKYAGDYCDR